MGAIFSLYRIGPDSQAVPAKVYLCLLLGRRSGFLRAGKVAGIFGLEGLFGGLGSERTYTQAYRCCCRRLRGSATFPDTTNNRGSRLERLPPSSGA